MALTFVNRILRRFGFQLRRVIEVPTGVVLWAKKD